MSAAGYPVVLRLAGKRCVVVGGGQVAARKVRGLIVSGADITVIAPELAPEIEALVGTGQVRALRRPFEPADLDDTALVFAATDNRCVNAEVAQAARARGTLVTVADDPESCDFTVPAVVTRGDVTLAISTGGRSPAFSRFLREQLQEWLTDARCELLEQVAALRRELRSAGRSVDPARWQQAMTDPTVARFLGTGDRESARRRLREILTAEQ